MPATEADLGSKSKTGGPDRGKWTSKGIGVGQFPRNPITNICYFFPAHSALFSINKYNINNIHLLNI